MMWALVFPVFIYGLWGMCVMNGSVVYRAKENETVPVGWSLQQETDLTLMNMICEFHSDSVKIVYEAITGSSESPDEQFVGRVHFDRDAPREAKIRLHLSRLRMEDSGNYCCYLNANYDNVTRKWGLQMIEHFVLNVTTGGNHDLSNTPCYPTSPDAEHPSTGPDQNIRWGIGLSVGAVLLAVVVYILYSIVRARR